LKKYDAAHNNEALAEGEDTEKYAEGR